MSGRSVRVTLRVWEDSEPAAFSKLSALRPSQRRAILGMALPIALDSIPDPASVKGGRSRPRQLEDAPPEEPSPDVLIGPVETVPAGSDRELLVSRAAGLAGDLL